VTEHGGVHDESHHARVRVVPGAIDEVARQGQQIWQAVAPAWERHRDRIFDATRAISERLVDLVGPRPGNTILELTAGTGETGFLLADRIGADGRLISTDFSEAMVQAAARGATQRGLANVEFRVIDAQAIDLPDGSVDGVLSRFGLMLVPDPRRALEESHRVLRPGGRLAYAVWGAMDRNPWITLLAGALLQRGHAPGGDPFGPGGLFSLAELDHNAQLANEAGFSDVEVEEISGAMQAQSPDDYWDFQSSISGPVATLLAALSPDERATIRTAFHAATEPYCAADGCRLPFCALVLHSTR
jgi:ubiquinone/menaquinone biosynthesis C-methylase UbiE